MKFVTLLAMAVLSCLSAHAQSVQDDVAALEKKRVGEVARATDNVNRTYLREYERLMQRANLVGDAQGANLVRTMIRRLNPEPEPCRIAKPATTTSNASTDPAVVLTSNHWINEFTAQNGHHRNFPRVFLPGGEMTSTTRGQAGTWKIVNNELVIGLADYPDANEKYLLPVQLEKWRGIDKIGTVHLMSVDRPGVSGGPAPSPNFFGKPNP